MVNIVPFLTNEIADIFYVRDKEYFFHFYFNSVWV